MFILTYNYFVPNGKLNRHLWIRSMIDGKEYHLKPGTLVKINPQKRLAECNGLFFKIYPDEYETFKVEFV